jgi:F0F1-type ATP synthase assembly protein I
MSHYLALAQVGMEMVAPVGFGLVLDYYLRWAPWATIGGALFGLISGIVHLVALSNRWERMRQEQQRDKP